MTRRSRRDGDPSLALLLACYKNQGRMRGENDCADAAKTIVAHGKYSRRLGYLETMVGKLEEFEGKQDSQQHQQSLFLHSPLAFSLPGERRTC